MKPVKRAPHTPDLSKCPTGIQGLDEITDGGLPRGRPTLVCGTAGCGKTLLAMEFLLRGAMEFDEPGVFLSFEETGPELTQNFRPLGFDLDGLIRRKKIAVDYVYIDRNEIQEAGDYDLEGLFLRLSHAIAQVGARRVVLDTIEALFSGLSNPAILRAELRRLFRWLKDHGLTAIITGEQGEKTLTRYGLEEYVADCVIALDHRIIEQTATRRMRIVKYRGSKHGTNEYPFLIDEHGISVLPITSLDLSHRASTERIPSGIERLDTMMGGRGYYRGSNILVSGTAGTGKTSIAAHFAQACCRRGERCLWFAFEESPEQIMRNMRSIGIDLEPWVRKGLLYFHATRPTLYGLEMHLVTMHKLTQQHRPEVVIVDPVTNFLAIGSPAESKAMLIRLVDFFKSRQITTLFTSLSAGGSGIETTDVGISSIMDTWLLLRDIENSGERNRGIYLLKSRGMAHSNQIREFQLTNNGVELLDVYLGPSGTLLTGSSRIVQDARDKAETLVRRQDIERKQREIERKRRLIEAQIAALRAEFESECEELNRTVSQEELGEKVQGQTRTRLAEQRQADQPSAGKQERKS